ncbi:putative RNA-directed DNA polymerase [Aphis craccivora]|uniref:Putative RNA-directed DNA polymerase n=1 Tax=Aphis craccivora TaxID=307492 RepID=A0A6G0YUJ7_APHCR|nr:putative RNA-directed DNA polymerase [Aphis craccivora]
MSDTFNNFTKEITVYITGFVIHKWISNLKCDVYIKYLIATDKQQFLNSFINLKNQGGLVYPSDDMFIEKNLVKQLNKNPSLHMWYNKLSLFQGNLSSLATVLYYKLVNFLLVNSDLRICSVNETATIYYKCFHAKLQSNPNQLIRDLAPPSLPGNPTRRLKRNWCCDLKIV